MSVSGDSVTEATISGLTPSTTYSTEVAAVNVFGTGTYSTILQIQGITDKCSPSFLEWHVSHTIVCRPNANFLPPSLF